MYKALQAIFSSFLQAIWCLPQSVLRRPMALPLTLASVIAQDQFPHLTDTEAVLLFVESFPAEIAHLQHASVTVESGSSTPLGCCDGKSPSALICGTEHAEVNRTLISMLALKWLLANDYDSFVRGQPEEGGRLTWESFQQMRRTFTSLSHDALYALLVATIIDDIGKDPNLSHQADLSHSEVVYHAASTGRIPSLSTVPSASKETILQSLQIGSKLNLSQLVQGECPPASLSVLRAVQSPSAFEMRARVTLLDVAGAGAHRDARGCVMMTESVSSTYLRAIEVVREFPQGVYRDERACYDRILEDRAELLHGQGFELLSTRSADERALLRLFCMGRVGCKESAVVFQRAFDALLPTVRLTLVDGLGVDGIGDGVAVVPYYAPGLLAEVLRGCHDEKDDVVPALSAFLRFLARVFGSQPRSEDTGVVERDLSFVQAVIKDRAFAEDPSVLDTVRLPWMPVGSQV
ncbi:uncharacterized protein ACLA_018250 [Aspergillus clavatus NRRL 1]|uniref:Queuosine salvage protein n=1 Tax=Aspergillus clavatus (strain ATCC 1007 / CBS 513.65 / DSM 816 / NCTC 3887 / NRRL 1 / QM 1276 / 107) TaxID=344612 RepID=A1CNA0_ASPCL|nr:uncharacterized protein ACLA_018250 [Aspergillus clavatus NRRL 1]EAW07121.1 conserved hypothetical protein [Aspergillus clavatus NRRL 1]